ncbi:MAG: hypothetical protein HXY18_06905 [Bryobacteraceae bacterium]|nr:hypothetical protein [Bryobacteraceae bacterium]
MKSPHTRILLPPVLPRRLDVAGIYCQSGVPVERRQRSESWVLRGVESGGATKAVGQYTGFFGLGGDWTGWLQRLDRITPNGLRAVFEADSLLAVEMARVEETGQRLITSHEFGAGEGGKRPAVKASALYRGVDGRLPAELRQQGLTPLFFSRAGEVKPILERVVEAVSIVTAAVCCLSCRHCHALIHAKTQAAA